MADLANCALRHMLAHTWLMLCITSCVQGLGSWAELGWLGIVAVKRKTKLWSLGRLHFPRGVHCHMFSW